MPQSKSVPDEEILRAIRSATTPAVTTEVVAESVGISSQGAMYRLKQLAEEGRVESAKPSRDRLWWIPACSTSAG